MPPFARLDHVVIAVRDLDAAEAAYAAMLGRAPAWRGRHPAYGTANVVFGLPRCSLELLAAAGEERAHPVGAAVAAAVERRPERLFALALGTDDLTATAGQLVGAGLAPGPVAAGEARAADGRVRTWRSCVLDPRATRGVTLFAIEHDDPAALPPSPATAEPAAAVTRLDHVVLFSDDLAGALALWRDRLGIPVRWRRELAARGTANVGLRLGGVTIELAAPLAGAPGTRGERAWGLAYAVPDIVAAVDRIRAAGLAASDVRTGIAPGSRVATVTWPERLPTLLVQYASGPS